MGIFSAGVFHIFRSHVSLLNAGDHLASDRAAGVRGVDEIEKMGRHRSGELGSCEKDAGTFFLGEGEVLFDVFQSLNTVLELPFGRVPVLRGNIGVGPVTWGV